MLADSPWARSTSLLLALALLSSSCAPLPPPPGLGMNLRYTPREAVRPALAEGPRDEPAWRSALAAHLAFRGAVGDVSGSTRRISGELSRLRASGRGIGGGVNGIFVRYVEYGERQLRWIDAELAAATRLANTASEVEDPDMQFAILRLAGPRLESAMLGSLLLAAWVDFINLVDVVLKQGFNGVETLFVNLDRWQKVTGKAGAGMAEPPRHHVMPKEFREWFEKRGFTGEMDIDQFCVELEQANHEAIHGGGDWKLGRTWPGEWNRMIMETLQKAETRAGRMLTRNEILNLVAEAMEDYNLPMNFTPWRGR